MMITYRPVSMEDVPFLFRVYASTRQEEMEQVPWTEEQKQAFLQMQFEAQLHHYQNHFPGAQHVIILHHERPVGRLYVNRTPETIHVLDITLLPEERQAGIGSKILKELLHEAERTQSSVRGHVEEYNRSLRLLERLGFQRCALNGVHLLMEWRPHSAHAPL